MRTIPEVSEDIKSILNNIERTEECTGETLVDISELVDEILTINCYKDKPKSNADRIRSMSDEELAEFLNTLFVEGQIEALHEQYPDSVFNRKESSLKWLQSEAE